jgi:hypothetical protein
MDERDDALSVLIMVTGPVALVISTGWQVAWLVLLAVFAVLRRRGTPLPGGPRPAASPPDPAGA